MRKFLHAGVVAALAFSGGVHAAYTITLTQVGPDVVATGNGSINLTALTQTSVNVAQTTYIQPTTGVVLVGPPGTNVDAYDGMTGPANFGAGGLTNPTTTSGNKTGWGLGFRLVVPTGYVSGAPLTGGATWNGTTIATLGATPGTYVWTWGVGPTADSLTLQIGPPPVVPATASVPTLSEWAMVLLATMLAGVAVLQIRRRE